MLLLKNLLFTLIVPGTFAVYVPLRVAQNRFSASSGMTVVIALAMFVAGGAIYAWCVWDFAAFGRGTPAPFDAPKKLVVRGLYRYTRNPMYVRVLTVMLGWGPVPSHDLIHICALLRRRFPLVHRFLRGASSTARVRRRVRRLPSRGGSLAPPAAPLTQRGGSFGAAPAIPSDG